MFLNQICDWSLSCKSVQKRTCCKITLVGCKRRRRSTPCCCWETRRSQWSVSPLSSGPAAATKLYAVVHFHTSWKCSKLLKFRYISLSSLTWKRGYGNVDLFSSFFNHHSCIMKPSLLPHVAMWSATLKMYGSQFAPSFKDKSPTSTSLRVYCCCSWMM